MTDRVRSSTRRDPPSAAIVVCAVTASLLLSTALGASGVEATGASAAAGDDVDVVVGESAGGHTARGLAGSTPVKERRRLSEPVAEEAGPFTSGFRDGNDVEDSAKIARVNERISQLIQEARYADALPLAKQALELAESTRATDAPVYFRALNNLAWIEQAIGQIGRARALFEQSLHLQEDYYGSNDVRLAPALNNLASVVMYEGDYKSARPLYERAAGLIKNKLGPSHPALGGCLSNLGVLAENEGKTGEALDFYKEALRIDESSLGADAGELCDVLNNLAVLEKSSGHTASARAYLERVLRIQERTLGQQHPDVAATLNNLGALAADEGNTDAAEKFLLKGLDIYEYTLGPNHPDVAVTLGNLARIDLDCGRQSQANERLVRAANIVDRHVRSVLPSLSLAEQAAFLDSRIPMQCIALLKTCGGGNQLKESYGLILRWKGLLIECLRQQRALDELSQGTELVGQVARLKALRSEIASWFYKAGSVPWQEWQARNQALTAEKERLERSVSPRLAKGSPADILTDVDAVRFCSLLQADEAFVDLYRLTLPGGQPAKRDEYVAVISTASGPQKVVALGNAEEIDVILGNWLKSVVVGNDGTSEWQELTRTLWQPIKNTIPSGQTRLWVSPDAGLFRIPWHLFPDDSRTAAPLLVSQLDSPRELAHLRLSVAQPTAERPSMLLVGNVDFGPADRSDDALQAFPLPGTLAEVDAVGQLARDQGFDVVQLTGREATKPQVLARLRGSAQVHLATHGFFLRKPAPLRTQRPALAGRPAARNPLVESGLILASTGPVAERNRSGGRLLTAEELVGLNLGQCQSVTLSACESGLGEQASGQGVLGLRAAFMAAGARCLLISLWKVPDESTCKLMQAYYTNLWQHKLSRAESLRKAQEALRQEPHERFKQPRFWAGWVLVGEAW